MSRGFVKEDDQEDIPMIPPRAHLPPGVTNYVTPEGMEALKQEKKDLLDQREAVSEDNEKEERIARNIIDAKIKQLESRIATARVSVPIDSDDNKVRFGSYVKLETLPERNVQEFRIVGVDEADIRKSRISFLSPLAKALLHKEAGESTELQLPAGKKTFRILEVSQGKL